MARTAGGSALTHVEVDGWANGYIVPPSTRPRRITIDYTPQALTSDGLVMVWLGMGILVLAGLAVLLAGNTSSALRRRVR
jgi:hypothetical protein